MPFGVIKQTCGIDVQRVVGTAACIGECRTVLRMIMMLSAYAYLFIFVGMMAAMYILTGNGE